MKKTLIARRFFTAAMIGAFLVLPSTTAFAQETEQEQEVEEAQEAIETAKELKAVPGEDRKAAVGSPVLFDGSGSTNPLSGDLEYSWSFGDGRTAEGVDATHTFNRPGSYTVELIVDNGPQRDTESIQVTVFEQLVVMIADRTLSDDDRKAFIASYDRRNVLLTIIDDVSGDPASIVEENLSNQLIEARDDLQDADVLIDWTDGTVGMSALAKFAQDFEGLEELNFSSKAIVSVGSTGSSLARVTQSAFEVLGPEYILLADEATLDLIAGTSDSEDIIPLLQATGGELDYRIIGIHSERVLSDLRPWNFMSFLVNFMINRGVPVSSIVLVLLLPVVATLIAFARQIIGVKGFGIYTPTIITLAFLATGLTYGLIIFLVILLAGSLTRMLLKKLRLLYIPRIAIILTAVTLAILGILAVSADQRAVALSTIAIFPILILVTLVEKFVNAQIEKGIWPALRLSAETLVLSIVAYLIASWEPIRAIFLAYPELILITLVINFALGRWTGLRLSEYLRFRQVRRYLKE